MNLKNWLALRGASYVGERSKRLLQRYGIGPSKASRRIEGCVAALAGLKCAPTFPTPGQVVKRHPRFVQHLQATGAEIAVHGYYHVDLRTLEPTEARDQLLRAAKVFTQQGIEVHGVRGPYLSCSDSILSRLPEEAFEYSSNKAIWWDVVSVDESQGTTAIRDALNRFYRPESAQRVAGTPRTYSNLIEIPVSLPDDLQLYDGFHLDPEAMGQAWCKILCETHRRGGLFVLQFHPELANICEKAFLAVLGEAERLGPPVWVARLRDICDWWREKARFAVSFSQTAEELQMDFSCSDRATILVRDSSAGDSTATSWYGQYRQVVGKTLRVPAQWRPFVGLSGDVPEVTVSFLREQGYIVELGETAKSCATYIDNSTLSHLDGEVGLMEHIEDGDGPLVRYGQWPSACRSALCLSGDLDALSLLDYASRLFGR